jgi:hypothetical protein
MTEYCTATDVQNRCTANGYLNLVDRDYSGTSSDDEVTANVTSAIERAGGKIDFALANSAWGYGTACVRNSGNTFTRDLAIAIASWILATNGGREPPEAFQIEYDEALGTLEQIKDNGLRVPGADACGARPAWSETSHEVFEVQSGGIT